MSPASALRLAPYGRGDMLRGDALPERGSIFLLLERRDRRGTAGLRDGPIATLRGEGGERREDAKSAPAVCGLAGRGEREDLLSRRLLAGESVRRGVPGFRRWPCGLVAASSSSVAGRASASRSKTEGEVERASYGR